MKKSINKKFNISKCILFSIVIIACLFSAFLGEYITNDVRNVPEEYRTIIDENDLSIKLIDAERNESGDIIAKKEDAQLIINYKYGTSLCIYADEDSLGYVDVEINGTTEDKFQIFPLGKQEVFSYYYDISKDNNHQIEVNFDEGCTIADVKIDNRYVFNYYKFAFILVIELLIVVMGLMFKHKYQNIEVIFLINACVVIVVMSTMLPISTCNSWDEQIHYGRVANIIPATITKADIDFANRAVPVIYDITGERNTLETISNDSVDKDDSFAEKELVLFDKSVSGIYNRITYFPSAIVTSLTKVIGGSISFMFIAGRLINGLLYIVLIYFAIRKLKSGKIVLTVIALMPLSVFMASVYSYDWWVNGFTILGMAYLFGELQRPDQIITLKSYIIMVVSFIVGCGAKAIYFPMVLCCVLLKKEKYKSASLHTKGVLGICLAAIIIASSFLLSFLVEGPGSGDARGGSGVNATMQVAYILGHPLEYSKTLISFIVNYLSPLNLSNGFASLSFVTIDNNTIIPICGFACAIILLIALLLDDNGNDTDIRTTKNRIVVWGISFAVICLFSTALYVSFTEVGLDTIAGVQMRYIMPIIFPALAMMGSDNIKCMLNKGRLAITLITSISLVSLYEIGMQVIRFYY